MFWVQREMVVWACAGQLQQTLALSRKRRAMIILVLMVAAFALSWTPLYILNTLKVRNLLPTLSCLFSTRLLEWGNLRIPLISLKVPTYFF